jgi:hypothetical protein
MKTNWRDRDEVNVGWIGKPQLGTVPCQVVRRDRTNEEPHGVREVLCLGAGPFPVAFCHSEGRYVWVK